jgi:hypothetical protein
MDANALWAILNPASPSLPACLSSEWTFVWSKINYFTFELLGKFSRTDSDIILRVWGVFGKI